jgi:hypothetical protein
MPFSAMVIAYLSYREARRRMAAASPAPLPRATVRR